MKVTAQMKLSGGETVGELISSLREIPSTATARVIRHIGDRLHPDWYELEFTWDTKQAKPHSNIRGTGSFYPTTLDEDR